MRGLEAGGGAVEIVGPDGQAAEAASEGASEAASEAASEGATTAPVDAEAPLTRGHREHTNR